MSYGFGIGEIQRRPRDIASPDYLYISAKQEYSKQKQCLYERRYVLKRKCSRTKHIPKEAISVKVQGQ
jgi:hypothetical protein